MIRELLIGFVVLIITVMATAWLNGGPRLSVLVEATWLGAGSCRDYRSASWALSLEVEKYSIKVV